MLPKKIKRFFVPCTDRKHFRIHQSETEGETSILPHLSIILLVSIIKMFFKFMVEKLNPTTIEAFADVDNELAATNMHITLLRRLLKLNNLRVMKKMEKYHQKKRPKLLMALIKG